MGTDDPYDRQYRPPLGDGRDVGDVGSGEEFGGDIYRLYLSGRVFIPRSPTLLDQRGRVSRTSARPSRGSSTRTRRSQS